MANILISDLPEEIYRALERRAEDRGQSLELYLTAELSRLATSPSFGEVLPRIEEQSGGRVDLEQAAERLAPEHYL